MGQYIDNGNLPFRRILNSDFTDKSGLLNILNKNLDTENSFMCVSRPRRFGKSVAAKMAYAYYDRKSDSRGLFEGLEITKSPDYEKHLNKYPTIYIDWNEFANVPDKDKLKEAQKCVIADLKKVYEILEEKDSLGKALTEINEKTGDRFILIIDEWDMLVRDVTQEIQDEYVNFLRSMFKTNKANNVFLLVYMTGILPIIKIKTQSALNNFREYSIIYPANTAKYYGFTETEVETLCKTHNMNLELMKHAYDGYIIGEEKSMFNPNSVMQAIRKQWCDSYWSKTGATDAISGYINMNYDGLKDDIIRMIAGERCKVNPNGFKNDLSQVNNRDDVLTVLIHLGYLSYDRVKRECRIPNLEVLGEMENAINDVKWVHVGKALQESEQLLEDTLAGNAEAVARGVDAAHSENTSILSYNDENSMACVLSIAYYFAHGDYIFHREYASGKGFADLVLIPRKNVDSPAIVIELKYGHSAEEAISQIKERRYWEKVSDYSGDVLLVGISYDREAKTHECIIKSLSIDR